MQSTTAYKQQEAIPTQLLGSSIKEHPILFKSGFYLVEILSAYEYINKKNRRVFTVLVKTIDDLYAWFYFTLTSPTGRPRNKDIKRLENLQVVADIIELAPKKGLGVYYSYQDRALGFEEKNATYPDLVGKKFIAEISASRDYHKYTVQMNYCLINIFHPSTFQTADEILENFSFKKPKPVGLLGVVDILEKALKSVDLREIKQGIKSSIKELIRLEVERRNE